MTKHLFKFILFFFSSLVVPNALWAQTEVQIMTFNVRYDNPSDPLTWEDRKEEVAQVIAFNDIVGVQEALAHQAAFIESYLPNHTYFGVGRDDGRTAGEFCPVFYNTQKFDFVHGETIWLSTAPWQPGSVGWDADLPRIATIVILQHKNSGKMIRVINTHFSHVGETARENAAQLIRGYVANSAEEQLIVLGDFNEEANGNAFRLLDSPPLKDSFERNPNRCRDQFTTFCSFNPDESYVKRIDHIFTNMNVEWVCIEEVLKFGYFISDHHPLFIVVNL